MPSTSPLSRGSLNLLTRYSLEVSQEFQRRSSFSGCATSSATLSQRLTSPLAQYSAFAKRQTRWGHTVTNGDVNYDKKLNGAAGNNKKVILNGERQSLELGSSGRERRKRLYRRSREVVGEKNGGKSGGEFDDDDMIEVGSVQDVSCALRVESLLGGEIAGMDLDKEKIQMTSSSVWLRGKVKLRERFRIRRTRWLELEGCQLSCHGKAGGKSRWVIKDMRDCGVWYNLDYRKVVVMCSDGTKLTWFCMTSHACWKWVAALQFLRKSKRPETQQGERVVWVDDLHSYRCST